MKHAFYSDKFHFEVGQVFPLHKLSESLLKHLKSLRLKDGETFVLMNGLGSYWDCRLKNKEVMVENSHQEEHPEPEIEICLSPPVGDALAQSVQQMTEVGVSRVRFIRSDHSQYKKDAKLPVPRLERVANASIEQCFRAWKLELGSGFESLDPLLPPASSKTSEIDSFFCDELLAQDPLEGDSAKLKFRSKKIRLFIGPEGGWSEAERQKIGISCQKLSLGTNILRVPTACVAAPILIRHLWQRAQSR